MNAAYYQKYIEFIYPIKHNIIMKLRYKYRIYPSELQEHNLNQTAGNARFIWNHFLKLNKDKYEKEKKFIFYNEMANQLPNLKQSLSWLSLSYSQILQAKLKDLDLALNDRIFECDECGYVHKC
jgi:putative transposase